MPERTIKAVFYNYVDDDDVGHTAYRDETLDFTEQEAARGDRLGAFYGTDPAVSDASGAAFNNTGLQGGVNTNVGRIPEDNVPPSTEAAEGIVPSELTDDQIDQLSGQALDDAVEAADIDASEGGSLSDGSLSADEKRDALKSRSAA